MWDFTVFKHPTLGYRAIRQDAQLCGFMFSSFWLLYKRVWGKGLATLAVALFGTALWQASIGFAGQYTVWGVVALMVGFKGGKWLAASLADRGFKDLGNIKAKSADGAIASYVSKETADA